MNRRGQLMAFLAWYVACRINMVPSFICGNSPYSHSQEKSWRSMRLQITRLMRQTKVNLIRAEAPHSTLSDLWLIALDWFKSAAAQINTCKRKILNSKTGISTIHLVLHWFKWCSTEFKDEKTNPQTRQSNGHIQLDNGGQLLYNSSC